MVYTKICLVLSILGIAAARVSRTIVSEHALKTITTEYGDIYDCIDFYKQPALDHPLLETHSFHPQMRPSFQPQWMTNNVSWKMNATEIEITPLRDGGCPQGTVPIRRMEKNKVHSPPLSLKSKNRKQRDISGIVFAVTQTKSSLSNVYNGVGAIMNIYKPKVTRPQYSSAEIIIKSGSDTIIVGWTVNPNKYRDDQTRFFIYSIAGDMQCFNSECGFVLVKSDIPLDFVMQPVSTRGGQIFVHKFFVYRDTREGKWWLQINGIKDKPITLGFWPMNIFPGLKSPGTYAACGGEIYTPGSLPPPEMGSGYYPDASMTNDAFCEQFVVVDDKNNIVFADDTEVYANDEAYGMKDRPTHQPFHRFHFGGPNP